MTEPAQIEELNTGLLLYIPYRAMEARVFKAMAAAGVRGLHSGAGEGMPAHRARRQPADRPCRAGNDYQTVRRLPRRSVGAGRLRGAGPGPIRCPRTVGTDRRAWPPDALAAAVVSEVEAEWNAHLGKRRMSQLEDTRQAARDHRPVRPISAGRHMTRATCWGLARADTISARRRL